jgi:hypothetical protein
MYRIRSAAQRILQQPTLRSQGAYNNHPAIDSNLAKVEAKFAKEEERLFHIHLPWFLVYFISGLLLNLIHWVVWKGKSRIYIDCTNGPDDADTTSSANTFILSPFIRDVDVCPPV